jgi:hypothetical protein
MRSFKGENIYEMTHVVAAKDGKKHRLTNGMNLIACVLMKTFHAVFHLEKPETVSVCFHTDNLQVVPLNLHKYLCQQFIDGVEETI